MKITIIAYNQSADTFLVDGESGAFEASAELFQLHELADLFQAEFETPYDLVGLTFYQNFTK